MRQRIGIYSGTFDPVHVGHIAFALQSIKAVKLDKLYFLPERLPRTKHGVTHFGHRIAMLRQAIRPHANFGIIDLPDRHFTIVKTLPRIRQHLGRDVTLVFLFGSDVTLHLADWPHIDKLLHSSELCIGLRSQDSEAAITKRLARLNIDQNRVHIVHAFAPTVSSTQIRQAIRTKKMVYGILRSVYSYANQEWLYI